MSTCPRRPASHPELVSAPGTGRGLRLPAVSSWAARTPRPTTPESAQQGPGTSGVILPTTLVHRAGA